MATIGISFASYYKKLISRGKLMVSYKAHNLGNAGSTPAPAIMAKTFEEQYKIPEEKDHDNRCLICDKPCEGSICSDEECVVSVDLEENCKF